MKPLSHPVTLPALILALTMALAGLPAQAQTTSPPAVPPPPPAAVQTAPAPGVAARQEAQCKAQWAAYAQSQRCFNACGATGREGARNNAACGHCTDTPMPACPEPR
ncbi:hypothetical protein [Hydrogenophaga sp. IBVHS2]|uniref:hypothetical protein n=1 Tax=Hydrogenophaga sp. IBVHS2 TaxID=1985170 RepID=UPI00117B200F|nr:hypothetical protein [Hydrogenophaga sp. IBVHS2]